MARKAFLFFIAVSLLLVCPSGQTAWAGEAKPLTIVRASVDENDIWTVDEFTSVPASGLAGAFELPADSTGMSVSLIDYALFRARYLVDFEGALREGIALEFQRRDRIKRASYVGAYLYCIPAWPLHLLWELPLSGAEKDRMLDKEGITIVLPTVESSSIGEIPLSITGDGHLELAGSTGELDLASYPGSDGVGLHLSYESESKVSIPEPFPGWGGDTAGEILLLLDSPGGRGMHAGIEPSGFEVYASKWPGRYEWAMGSAVLVFVEETAYLGVRRIKAEGDAAISVDTLMPEDISLVERLSNEWPPVNSLMSRSPYFMLVLPGLLIVFVVFLAVNALLLRISYRRRILNAILDALACQACILFIGTILSPFLGLGWIGGAYVAGRYLKRRYPRAGHAWLAMVIHALAVMIIYEFMFANPLWI